MIRSRLIPAVLALSLVFAAIAMSGSADAQSTDSGESGRSKTMVRFSYSPIYQFETDLDSGGSFDVQRHFLRVDISRFIDRQ